MDIVRTLMWADSIAVTRWFTTKSISRFIVAILFFLVFCAVALGVYAVSHAFFRSLTIYDQFGQMTAGYIIHASVVIILWLALGSSIASATGLLLSTSPSLSYILTLPVPAKALNIWLFVKAVTANFLLMAFAFVPIVVAYANAFGILSVSYLLRIVFVLLCIVSVSSAIGMVLGLISVVWLRGREYPASAVGIIAFFSAMVGILKLIFPPMLSQLYDASAPMFLPLFRSLPLNNPNVPTAWLSHIIISGFAPSSFLVLSITAAVVIVCLEVQRTRIIPTLLRLRSSAHVNRISQNGFRTLGVTNYPLVIKDWFSIVRLPSEVGYGLFLGSVALFFFFMLYVGIGHSLHQGVWNLQLTVFSFAWIGFFATAYFLRFLFPLVAREGKSAWYIFTLPITKRRILFEKILLSILFCIPVAVFSVFIWYLLPFVSDVRGTLIGVSVIFILVLALTHALLGAILPNFLQGNDPEKISTSGMGLLVLLVSGILVAGASQLITYSTDSSTGGVRSIVMLAGIGIAIVISLWSLSRKFTQRWEW